MLRDEIASAMKEDGKIFKIASKEKYNVTLDQEEKEIASIVDVWAKNIGDRGQDAEHELADFIQKNVNPIVYDTPDQILDTIFDRGAIEEFDDETTLVNPKNNLHSYEAAKGGSVPKSYVDYTAKNPVWKHRQIETEITYAQLRKNGWKSVANLATFCEEELKNSLFCDVLNAVDDLILVGNTTQYFGTTGLTIAGYDELSLFLLERASNPFILTRTYYSQQIARMIGTNVYQHNFMSDGMKENFNRYGLIDFADGCRIAAVPSVVTHDGVVIMPDKTMLGFAGKVGTLDMRGALRVYEDFDNKAERVELKLTGFEYGWTFDKPENMGKLYMA